MANITKIIGTIQEITGEDGKTRIALVDETNGLGESFKEILIAINPVFEIQTAGTNYEESCFWRGIGGLYSTFP